MNAFLWMKTPETSDFMLSPTKEIVRTKYTSVTNFIQLPDNNYIPKTIGMKKPLNLALLFVVMISAGVPSVSK